MNRFNGATSFQTWKYSAKKALNAEFILLQWSHIFSDVEMFRRVADRVNKSFKLQWSHIFSDVEMLQWRRVRANCRRASMEPHLFRRGNCRKRIDAKGFQLASMEPHLFRRGNSCRSYLFVLRKWASMEPHLFRRGNPSPRRMDSASSRCFNGATSFQTWKWRPERHYPNRRWLLQWSHIFSDVEIYAFFGRV